MQSLEHTVKDPRLSNIQWKEHSGDYGPYQSAFSAENTWLAELIKENANAKGYLLDQEGMYKYRLSNNGDFINRYKKSRAEQGRAPTDPAVVEQRREDRKGLEGTGTRFKSSVDWEKRDQEIKKGHQERLESDRLTREKIDDLNYNISDLASVIREWMKKEQEK